ncbi:MAG: ABC transporter ATP-binding protein [Pirellulales bacterium]|nr:ABC transporter ATP-binding protein [Pirellulales bacterium]
MKNFARTLQRVLRYKATLAASAGCAILVALLWGANIGGAYPVVEVIFRGQSLQEWVTKDIQASRANIQAWQAELAALPGNAPAPEGDFARARREELVFKLSAEETHLARQEWLSPLIHEYLPSDKFQTLLAIMMVLLAGTILKNVFLVFDSILVDRLTMLVMTDLRKKFFRRTLRLDLANFSESKTSDLLSRFTNDMDALYAGIQTLLGRAVREPLKMIVCLAGAAFVCWRLLLLSLVFAPIMGFLINRLAQSLKRANRRAMEEIAALFGILGETFGNIKVVKAFTRERHERLRFHRNNKEIFKRGMKIARYDALIHPLTEMMGISAICLGILAGAYLVLNQETHIFGIRMTDRPLSLSSLLIFYGLLVGTTDPARKLSDVFGRLQRAMAAGDRIYQYLDREPTIQDPPRPVRLSRHSRAITLENVKFAYHPDQLVLHNLSLEIFAGQTVAIVGPNGCGKSTLLNLIPRFYDPAAGSVRIDGIDIRKARVRELRGQIGLVTQEALLFDDTVFNNIRYGAPTATTEQVIAAAQQAHAHQFIEQQLEHGYQTIIGPQGARLSGGQRQRIALARAILRNPAILLLDEATSQIDPESEQEIHRALEEFIRGRTTIMITHRVSTLDLADHIVVMDRGTIVDAGPHRELFGRCEMYRRLHQTQLRAAA